jgi:hypothetical protein
MSFAVSCSGSGVIPVHESTATKKTGWVREEKWTVVETGVYTQNPPRAPKTSLPPLPEPHTFFIGEIYGSALPERLDFWLLQ